MTKKHFVVAAVAFLFICRAVHAQDESMSSDLLYIADYNIGWKHLPEWTEMHYEQVTPVLNDLVEEGLITGWSAWQHHTGGEYNWRMVFQTSGWDDFDEFWNAFFERMPEGVNERAGTMLNMHRDQIWELSEMRIADSAGPVTFAYEALYQVNFDDLEEWTRDYEEHVVPVLEQAMENGSLAGWVVLDHNAGARYNRNQIMLFNDWDNIDDVLGTLMESMFSDEERWQEIGAMVRGHDDNVWSQVIVPQAEN